MLSRKQWFVMIYFLLLGRSATKKVIKKRFRRSINSWSNFSSYFTYWQKKKAERLEKYIITSIIETKSRGSLKLAQKRDTAFCVSEKKCLISVIITTYRNTSSYVFISLNRPRKSVGSTQKNSFLIGSILRTPTNLKSDKNRLSRFSLLISMFSFPIL